MDIRVSGHQVETGDALRAHVEDRLQGIADKYFSRAISAQVTFGKGPHDHGFTCDIVAHVTQAGIVLLWIAAIITLYTGYDYFRAGLRHIDV